MDQRDSFEFTQQHTVHQTLQNLTQYSTNMFQVQKRCLAIKPIESFYSSRRVKTGRPSGWQWMKEFVDKDGNVFHKGKEQPNLKGTLPPTKVKPRKKKKKLTADQKLFKKAADWKKRLKAKRGK